jgi:hypothetical protein
MFCCDLRDGLLFKIQSMKLSMNMKSKNASSTKTPMMTISTQWHDCIIHIRLTHYDSQVQMLKLLPTD